MGVTKTMERQAMYYFACYLTRPTNDANRYDGRIFGRTDIVRDNILELFSIVSFLLKIGP